MATDTWYCQRSERADAHERLADQEAPGRPDLRGGPQRSRVRFTLPDGRLTLTIGVPTRSMIAAGHASAWPAGYRSRSPSWTRFLGFSPAAMVANCSRMSLAMRGGKASVLPPTCGVINALGSFHSRWSLGSGSGSVT